MTPCEEKGYKVGDRFRVIKSRHSEREGMEVYLSEDDGTESPFFKKDGESYIYVFGLLREGSPDLLEKIGGDEMTERVTLKPGDYVSTAGMDEATYHAVARAFIEAGAGRGEYGTYGPETCPAFGWTGGGDLYHGQENSPAEWGKRMRELTPEQVINATNAGGTPEPIAALRVAKATLDDARDAYSKALDAVRDELGEGFMLVEQGMRLDPADGTLQTVTLSEDVQPLEYTLGPKMRGWIEWGGLRRCPVRKGVLIDVKYRNGEERHSVPADTDGGLVSEGGFDTTDAYWGRSDSVYDIVAWRLADEPDMTDPANWRAGDVVECVNDCWFTCEAFKVGRTYELTGGLRDRGFIVANDDDEDDMFAPADHFRFHHRPNT